MVYNEEEYELTENEKKAISNELEELLNFISGAILDRFKQSGLDDKKYI